jgi:hypothetical protein
LFRPIFAFASSFLLYLCLVNPLSAQVFQVGGGTSSLYQSGGGSITVRASSYNLTLGAGTVAGHIFEGAKLVKATSNAKYILGDDLIDFHLPTDIFDTSHFMMARGAGVSMVRRQTDILAFAGGISTEYSTPLFEGAKFNEAAGMLFLKRKLSPTVQLFSGTVVTNKITEIEGVQWEPKPKLDLAFSAGVGANQPYAAASLNIARPRYDVQAAYIEAGEQFHRVVLISPLLAEPDRENILVTVRPFSFLTLTGGRQNYLVPQYPSTTNVRSSVDQGGVNFNILGASLSGAVYHSSYEGASNHAASFSATRDITSRIHATANYLVSRPKNSPGNSSLIATISENLNARLTANESVTYTNGRTSINFGGQLLTNLLAIGASYQTYYVPANNSMPFQQELQLDLKMNLFGRLMLHGESVVDPTGHLRYTADAQTVVYHGQAPGRVVEHAAIGSYILQGCVLDTEGHAIEGAALLVDEKKVFTDSDGCFLVRERKPRSHKLQVVLTEFLQNGNWQVVSAPTVITSAAEQDGAWTKIFVELRKVRVEEPTPPASITVPRSSN